MKNPNILHKDYTRFETCYQCEMSFDLECNIPANDCVRLLSQIVEEMDLICLYDTYSRYRENQASPRIMLKLVLYAYLDGKYSSREMGKACRRDINYMYLLEGKPVPDHATFARFRSLHFSSCTNKIMTKMTRILLETGELSGRQIFIDGTKIEVDAGKYTFVWKKAVSRNMSKLGDKIVLLVQECTETYGFKPPWHGQVKVKYLKKFRKQLYA